MGIFLISLANLYSLDPKTLSGLRYDSDFGQVYFLADGNGDWVFLYREISDATNNFGVMHGKFKAGEPFSYYMLTFSKFNAEFDVIDSGIFQMEMYGDLTFHGIWRSSIYDLWGKWSGTKTGSLSKEDLDWAKTILSKIQIK